MTSTLGCPCRMCVGGTVTLAGISPSLAPLVDEMARSMDRMLASRLWNPFEVGGRGVEPSRRPAKPVTCPDLEPASSEGSTVSDWALSPAIPITSDRFALMPRETDITTRTQERAFWDRPQPRRIR